jgi:hypothetical protein
MKMVLRPSGYLDREMYLARPLFPELFHRSIEGLVNEYALRRTLTSIEVTGAGETEADGSYVLGEYPDGRRNSFVKLTSPTSQDFLTALPLSN